MRSHEMPKVCAQKKVQIFLLIRNKGRINNHEVLEKKEPIAELQEEGDRRAHKLGM